MKFLNINEIFGPTIQGEGSLAGCPAIFVRVSGCNMWGGKLEDRHKSKCPYCDTDFVQGTMMSVADVIDEVLRLAEGKSYLVVITGGEPLLQKAESLQELCEELTDFAFITQLETNGSIHSEALTAFDVVSCSPKLPFEKLKIIKGAVDCWKILYPHPEVKLEPFIAYAEEHTLNETNVIFSLQPITSYGLGSYIPLKSVSQNNLQLTIQKVYELGVPWRLSPQTHHIIGVK